MSRVVGAFEAKTHFSRLLEQVERGEVFRITRHGRLVAELRPVPRSRVQPKPGLFKGQIEFAQDFDDPLDDLREYME